jgi:hypothetical protein
VLAENGDIQAMKLDAGITDASSGKATDGTEFVRHRRRTPHHSQRGPTRAGVSAEGSDVSGPHHPDHPCGGMGDFHPGDVLIVRFRVQQ